MNTAIDRKHELCERAKPLNHTQIYLPDKKEYVKGLFHAPDKLSKYMGEDEPVVSADDLYDLDNESSWITVNSYNALVLNTRNMLIADVDFGDPRLSPYAGAKSCEEVMDKLDDLILLDAEHHLRDYFLFMSQSYRVYRTHSGCRVICTSAVVPWEEMGLAAKRFMRFLRSDPKYMELCGVQKCYRARLTPKPWRDNGEPHHVCNLESTFGPPVVAHELREQLELHDELTLSDESYSHLA